ncbi:glycosyltransferase family 4 protein [Thalassobellus citreus]|uniref:glycosyltransferase family 4 protein n=1 Tax=Thalassobellus citreus TaxID=3367752 RepID=UPI0037BB5615
MKVLHCLNSPHIGGIERLVIELAIAQKKHGIDVSIMFDTRSGQYYEYLLEQDISILDSGIKGGFDFNYITYITLKKEFEGFQIVHLHSFSPIRALAAKRSKVKVLYTIHGLSKGVRKEGLLKYYIRESLKKWLLNYVDGLITNSNYTLGLAKQHYGLEKVKTAVILNGITLSDYNLDEKVNNSKEFTIGLVSRFTPRKRIDRLIGAFKKYQDLGGIGTLVLVGDGSDFNIIKKLVKDLKLGTSVILEGYKTNVSAYYKVFDVVVCPSENEPFGLVAVEAFIHGKPMIVFKDSGGMKEIIEPIEPHDIVENEVELAKRLLLYSKSKSYISHSAKQKISYAKKYFSIERMEQDYYKEYKSMLTK